MSISPYTISSGDVVLCIPIVAEDLKTAEERINSACGHKPDFIEFRRDSFKEADADDRLNEILRDVRKNGTGVIFTYRRGEEGGMDQSEEEDRIKVIEKAVNGSACDYIDVERLASPEYVRTLKDVAHKASVKVILSTHDFEGLPENIQEKLSVDQDADVIKGAFMAKNAEDVNILKDLGSEFRQKNPNTPLILIAMGEEGTDSRIFPEILSSNLTFVTDTSSSAPGQIPIETVRDLRAKRKTASA